MKDVLESRFCLQSHMPFPLQTPGLARVTESNGAKTPVSELYEDVPKIINFDSP